jgi:small subunit ribosomal protein S4
MGKPKFSRKKYETPSHPWQEDRIKAENELVKKYGLKNKREVWKARTKLSKFRGQARELLAKVKSEEAQGKKESEQLLVFLNRLNILPTNSSLDDVLALDIESILSRRLQTLSYLKGFANTPDQARQLIIHGHIAIGDRRVTIPGYMVTKDEEEQIAYTKDSPLNDAMHPARPKADFKSISNIKKTKPEDVKKEEKQVEKIPEKKPEPVIIKEKTQISEKTEEPKNDINVIKKGDE